MSVTLPKGWVETTIGEITKYIQRGKSPKYIDYSTLPVVNQKAIRWDGLITEFLKYVHPDQIDKWSVERYIQCGDILWNSTGTGTIGRACYITDVMAKEAKVVDSHVTIIRTCPNIDSIYCFRWIQSHHIQNIIKSLYTGSTNQVELSKEKISTTTIPLPPLNEQKRIVAKLDKIIPRIDSVQARLDRVPTIIKRFRQSVLTAAVTGKLTEKWREEHPEVESAEELLKRIGRERKEKYTRACFIAKGKKRRIPAPYRNIFPNVRQDSNLYELPLTWQWADLTFLMDENEPFCYGVVQPGPIVKNGNYLIRSGDLKNKTVRMDELRTISHKVDEQYKRSKIQGGEILITVVGAGIGTASIAPLECKGYNIARAVAKVPVKDFDSLYVLLWLSTSTARSWLIGESREVARPTLNLEQLATILVPLPPLEEQQEIVRQVDKLFALADKLDAHYQKAKTHVGKLSQAVLAKAFRGELVPQDPSDEPAEKLLARIMKEKNEKSQRPAAKRTTP